MKKYMFLFVLLLGVYSCHVNDAAPDYSRLITQFRLYDTTGVEKYTFKSGENFNMKFTVQNNSGEDLTYQYTGFSSKFVIYKADSLFCTSVDGLIFAQVLVTNTLKNGDEYQNSWTAPKTPGMSPVTSLPPGEYVAKVSHSCLFKEYNIANMDSVRFTVTE